MKPIDKTKKANRRCVNCKHWSGCPKSPDSGNWNIVLAGGMTHNKVCPVAGGKLINYWNCCKHFEWDPNKTYV